MIHKILLQAGNLQLAQRLDPSQPWHAAHIEVGQCFLANAKKIPF